MILAENKNGCADAIRRLKQHDPFEECRYPELALYPRDERYALRKKNFRIRQCLLEISKALRSLCLQYRMISVLGRWNDQSHVDRGKETLVLLLRSSIRLALLQGFPEEGIGKSLHKMIGILRQHDFLFPPSPNEDDSLIGFTNCLVLAWEQVGNISTYCSGADEGKQTATDLLEEGTGTLCGLIRYLAPYFRTSLREIAEMLREGERLPAEPST